MQAQGPLYPRNHTEIVDCIYSKYTTVHDAMEMPSAATMNRCRPALSPPAAPPHSGVGVRRSNWHNYAIGTLDVLKALTHAQ